jgi:hypothetical protein
MAESHVVSALVNKRAEIAGMIARTEQQLGQFRADLVHLDATIRLFAPGMEPKTIPAKRIRQSDLWFEQGELSRAARVQWKIRGTLNRLNKRGLLASDGTGHGVLWRSDGRAGQQKKHFS